jgi:hypothetical protein
VREPSGRLEPTAQNKNVTVHQIGRLDRLDPLAMRNLHRLLSSLQPDVILGWLYVGNVFASLAGYLSRTAIPVIWNFRHSILQMATESRAMAETKFDVEKVNRTVLDALGLDCPG